MRNQWYWEAISLRLKDAAYQIAACYAGTDAAANRFKEKLGIAVFKFDVSDYNDCRNTDDQIESELGPVAVLVNNAGFITGSTLSINGGQPMV